MLSDEEKKSLKGILVLLSHQELQSLSQTVTNNMILPLTTEEAIDAILLHSPTPESLLLRKRISKNILFRYLHSKKVPIVPTDKRTMINKILQMWGCTVHDNESTPVPVPEQESEPKSDMKVCEVDELARQFTHWFYSMLNQHDVYHQDTQLGVEHFWKDCNMQLVLNSEMGCSKTEVQRSAADVVQLICATRTQHNLYFNPNLSHEGVQGKTEHHGLVMVLACGTLHQQDRCVGIFEQLFGLIRDPLACNNWKIKYTELNLTSNSAVTSLPTLAEGSLLKSIPSVPNSIQSA
ncbi:hypothetical protein B7P43_G07985 [Cryptotermes secundus]|uniref:NTF2 domain-containing protein n=2 Tax=Cryptotermes secundus TaxID=105785 RepID=A0A2J7PHU4_9NEOP|nr:uncharacterized protein C3orf38 homolog isoform X2 [Cryptotermes secundus]XP_023724691.1 uncharacterized protein C3orf38 homolog isoform X2 [Cryptotermes secundus]XP_023724692.1 uncharacterized protein C3orf38 homolog isoform X2 [Cryptotermes secundus]XP_023724693.1 uncharacterized protein C3orf38 homolog isoform X2 [Cryptotermes secundus]XP_023724694.1 uncharacterized protein C3orf38 homolog isoform X2 [Cryptotermes secundus]PNF15905.1 hypothetical protein B7P43_G07985 [Cryptotermes secund